MQRHRTLPAGAKISAAKGVAFEVVGPDGVPPLVEADEGKVRQVGLNRALGDSRARGEKS